MTWRCHWAERIECQHTPAPIRVAAVRFVGTGRCLTVQYLYGVLQLAQHMQIVLGST